MTAFIVSLERDPEFTVSSTVLPAGYSAVNQISQFAARRTAARLPNSGICEIAVNASLAFVEGAKPRDEVESALVIQMACTHSAAMAVLNGLGEGRGGDRGVAAMACAAARLLRAYAAQVEELRRLKNGGSQIVCVEHVHYE